MRIALTGVKKALLRIGPIRDFRASLAARATRRQYNALVNHYRTPTSNDRTRHHLTGNGGLQRRWKTDGAKVFFFGTDEQQDRSGLLQALSSISDIRVFTRPDGVYGQNDPRPPIQRIPAITNWLLSSIEELAANGWTPDILIGQTWASVIDPRILSHIRGRWGTMVINISMDDRHQFLGPRLPGGGYGGVLPLLPHLDLALTAAPECVHWYEHEGCPALYFPEASDPKIFRPMPELPKRYDVCFVGARYGIRENLVRALRCAGVEVQAYGAGWEAGRLSIENVPRLFAQSKVILGVGTIGHCSDFYALKLRDFDAPMSGTCYLTHDNQDLYPLFDVGREIVTFRTIDECVAKAKHLLANDAERERIARAGRARAAREHTWDQRFHALWRTLDHV